MTSERAIGVGAFVVGGILLFALALFMIGNRRMLFSSTFTVYTEFKTLSGIEVGSSVRVAGMSAGEIKDIQVPSRPSQRFRIRMQVRNDLRPLVRTDSVVSIRTEGLVGAQFLQISAGSEQAPPIGDGATIGGLEPFELADLLQQASDTIRTVNQTILDLRGGIEATIATIQQTTDEANQLIEGVSGEVQSIAKNGAKVVADVDEIVRGVKAGRGTVGQLFTDDELYRRLAAIVADAQKTVESLRQTVAEAQQALAGATGKGGAVQTLSGNLGDTLTKTRETMDNLAEATEALKHNFLLRGYFNRRGYFSLSELSTEAYVAGALEKDGRRKLQIWLGTDVLFSGQPDGETLTEEGKQRLDSAMGGFLKYVRTSPLVVEGYAQADDEARRYLLSRSRADAVRTYLVSRFRLDPARVGIMPLGVAKGSPSGDGWDGVALALFVEAKALGREKEAK